MRNKRGHFCITIGLLLIAAAFSLTYYNFYDSRRAGEASRQIIDRLEECLVPEQKAEAAEVQPEDESAGLIEPEQPEYVRNPEMEMPVETIDGVEYVGILRIPTLELELPVIRRWSYPGLKTSPCRYSGSSYLDNLIICGHNYPSHFGNLKYLAVGDVVTFTDMDGNVFTYTVSELEILNPTDVEDMKSGGWDLTLFTCTIGGRTRVTVRCELEAP